MDVNEYLRLSRVADTLSYRTHDAGALVEVREHAGERWVYTGEDSILSLMRLDAPADPVLPNHIAMLAAMLFADHLPQSVLNLGFGTGAFERFFSDRLPAADVVSLDSSPTMVEIARQYFASAPEHPVIIQPADEFLHTNNRAFDLILCDIFHGDRHPDCLSEKDFYTDAARSLGADGVMAINLSPATEQALLDILLPLRQNFAQVLLVNLGDYGNLVVYAMQHAPVDRQEQATRAARLGSELRLDLHTIPARISVLPDRPGRAEVCRS